MVEKAIIAAICKSWVVMEFRVGGPLSIAGEVGILLPPFSSAGCLCRRYFLIASH